MSLRIPTLPAPLRIALVEPDIAGNTGNIARLCAATGAELHLVEPLGFSLSDSRVRRAGLDYWDAVTLTRHRNYRSFEQSLAGQRILYFSTKATRSYLDIRYRPGDALVFGSETQGLSEELLNGSPDCVLGIPMCRDNVRSLNVASAAAIVLYEALRQIIGSGRASNTTG